MKIRLLNFWETLRSSYWFVPTIMTAMAIAFSFVTITLDEMLRGKWVEMLAWTYAEPEGARTMLSTIAGSMITVAGVTFSITIVALVLASSQFGPRLLRNFMRDVGNQIVLGTFIATYIYGLLVLRTIRKMENGVFMPSISITFGVVLAIVSIGVLIYFVHHVAASIQAENVIAAVSYELQEAIHRLYPEKIGQEASKTKLLQGKADIPAGFDRKAQPVMATESGYLQAIAPDKLLEIAKENDLLLRLLYRPGDFVIEGSRLVLLWPGEQVDKKLSEQINSAFILGTQRTLEQDVEFAISQLVEVAVRALSPGINDPFTAIACVDRLGEALFQLAERDFPSPYRYDDDNKVRLITNPVTFMGVTNTAFDQIRQYARSHAAVTIHLLEMIRLVAMRASTEEQRTALLRQAIMIERGSHEGLLEEWDQKEVKERYQQVVKLLENYHTGPLFCQKE